MPPALWLILGFLALALVLLAVAVWAVRRERRPEISEQARRTIEAIDESEQDTDVLHHPC